VYFGATHIKEAFFGQNAVRGLPTYTKSVYAFAPVIFMVGAGMLQKAIAGISSSEFGMLRGKLGKAFGEYRAAVVRTQLHSESIAALRGAAVEKHIITQMFDQMMAVQVLPTTTCARLFSRWAAEFSCRWLRCFVEECLVQAHPAPGVV